MERINIQLYENTCTKLCSKDIEVSIIGDLNPDTVGTNNQVIVAYYYSNGTFNDSIFLADNNLKTIHEFSMAEQIITNPKNERENLTFLEFSPDATLLWIINDDTNYIYNTINYNLVHTWLMNDNATYGWSMSNDNTKVAYTSDINSERYVSVYENGKELFSYKHNDALYTKFSQNSKLVMSHGCFLLDEYTVKIHNSCNGDLLYDLTFEGPIRIINFTPDNNIIFFKGISSDKKIFDSDFYIWDVKDNKLIKKIENEHIDMRYISFSNDGKYMYCQLDRYNLKIIDTTNDKIIKRYMIEDYYYNREFTYEYSAVIRKANDCTLKDVSD
jgi:hypothetical protein